MTSIFITGISRGIGFEIARQALAKNWQVAGSVRKEKDKLFLESSLAGVEVLLFDVCNNEQLKNAAAQFLPAIDILINNAGTIGPERQSTLDMDFDKFAETLAINTIAPLRVTQAFLPNLRRGKNPRLITVSSNMGRMQYARSDQIAYRSSKSAANKIVQALATDLAPDNICVVAINPGWVKTDMGGPDADISVEESANGILSVVEALTQADTCQFIDWDGTRQSW